MFIFSRFLRICVSVLSLVLVLQMCAKLPPRRPSKAARSTELGQSISVVAWTDQGKYSLQDAVKVNASLQNSGDAPVYVDRRMFWTGFGGGLKLEINNEQGKPIPVRAFSDAIMPPPKEEDTSILIRLDEGFFYGTSVRLLAKDFFPKPGKYSIRVIYKSWLRKEFVAQQLRQLPAIWADAPEIASAPVSIELTQ